jgi:hypothetical protein
LGLPQLSFPSNALLSFVSGFQLSLLSCCGVHSSETFRRHNSRNALPEWQIWVESGR